MSEQKFDFQNIDLKLYLALRAICKDYLSLCEDAGGVMDSPPKEYVDAQLALAEFELSHGPLPNWAIARNWDYSLVAAAPAQGQQVECQQCGQLRDVVEVWKQMLREQQELYADAMKAIGEALGIDVSDEPRCKHVAAEAASLRAKLSALKAQQVGQEPAGEVHLRTGGGISLLHVELAQSLPPGTKLYTAPQPAPAQDVAGLVELLREADQELKDWQDVWPDCHDKATSDIRGRIAIALAAHDKQSGGEV